MMQLGVLQDKSSNVQANKNKNRRFFSLVELVEWLAPSLSNWPFVCEEKKKIPKWLLGFPLLLVRTLPHCGRLGRNVLNS